MAGFGSSGVSCLRGASGAFSAGCAAGFFDCGGLGESLCWAAEGRRQVSRTARRAAYIRNAEFMLGPRDARAARFSERVECEKLYTGRSADCQSPYWGRVSEKETAGHLAMPGRKQLTVIFPERSLQFHRRRARGYKPAC